MSSREQTPHHGVSRLQVTLAPRCTTSKATPNLSVETAVCPRDSRNKHRNPRASSRLRLCNRELKGTWGPELLSLPSPPSPRQHTMDLPYKFVG